MGDARRDGSPCADCSASHADRRTLIIGAAAVAAGFGNAAEAASDPAKMELQAGDRIQFTKGKLKGEFLRADSLEVGAAPIECFPFAPDTGVLRRGQRLNRMLALRLDSAELSPDTAANASEGVVVFSAICTHKGCTINSWMEEERRLRCHCHLSIFDARSVGDVKGGPAKHPLPMAPVALDAEGFVVAAAGFTSKPGGKTK